MAPQVAMLVKAIIEAQNVLAVHLAAKHHAGTGVLITKLNAIMDAKATVNSLLGILDDRKLVAAPRPSI
jgi:hypothetical protein